MTGFQRVKLRSPEHPHAPNKVWGMDNIWGFKLLDDVGTALF